MGSAALELFPEATAHYKFTNRGNHRFNNEFLDALKTQIELLKNLKLTDEEYVWFKNTCPWIRSWYFEYLKNYRYDPKQVEVCLDNTNNLCIDVKGKWSSAIYWEVPLMAIISELYFKMIDKNWKWEAAERINYRNMTMAKV